MTKTAQDIIAGVEVLTIVTECYGGGGPITEQTITDQAKYEKEFQQQATKTIKDAGGRFIVRTTEVTPLAGDPPKRVVVFGFESLDEVKCQVFSCACTG